MTKLLLILSLLIASPAFGACKVTATREGTSPADARKAVEQAAYLASLGITLQDAQDQGVVVEPLATLDGLIADLGDDPVPSGVPTGMEAAVWTLTTATQPANFNQCGVATADSCQMIGLQPRGFRMATTGCLMLCTAKVRILYVCE